MFANAQLRFPDPPYLHTHTHTHTHTRKREKKRANLCKKNQLSLVEVCGDVKCAHETGGKPLAVVARVVGIAVFVDLPFAISSAWILLLHSICTLQERKKRSPTDRLCRESMGRKTVQPEHRSVAGY